MKDILSEIVAAKRLEVARAKDLLPEEELRVRAMAAPCSSRSMAASLAASRSGIISEFKRKSPSKGWIHADADPLATIPGYASAGASALSILTDSEYFGGCQDFIVKVRPLVDLPILRKDFIIDSYQLLEARLIGADAVLLIAACLSAQDCARLLMEAHDLGLEVLLETHTAEEISYISDVRAAVSAAGRTDIPDMVGINNRNLGSFHTDVQNSFRLAEILKEKTGGLDSVLVSESGISQPQTVKALRDAGFRGFLMGENFMKQPDPAVALSSFISELAGL